MRIVFGEIKIRATRLQAKNVFSFYLALAICRIKNITTAACLSFRLKTLF